MSLVITGGIYRGRRIYSNSKSSHVRPTSGKVREALNNILRPKLQGSTFCDLFSGNGSVGFEALSHGASHVTFVENHKATFKILKENINILLNNERINTSSHLQNVYDFCQKKIKFDIVFADPPFTQPFNILWDSIKPLIKPGGTGVIQFPSRISKEKFPAMSHADSIKIYGESGLAFFYTGGI